MGCIVYDGDGRLEITGSDLVGGEFDLNAMPDALPALAVTACFAEGETRLYNVAQARLKETDRIKVMHDELVKMGADIEEMPDGLVIRRSKLKGAKIQGHADHRIVMAFAIAGLGTDGETVIDTAESASVTFPGFFSILEAARQA
jgi:3-phosphoshikimate 1-carboxyvinyltransferase